MRNNYKHALPLISDERITYDNNAKQLKSETPSIGTQKKNYIAKLDE
jgi:hypothetical protein